jgi:hypothetical protein
VLERRGKKPRLASLPAVLWSKRCCHDNERPGNEVNTFRLVSALQTDAILIVFRALSPNNLTSRRAI